MIGVLSLQGNFAMHMACLHKLNANAMEVRRPSQLEEVCGLIIPGGESSVMLKFLEQDPLWFSKLNQFFQAKKPIFGTCAGIILLAKQVMPRQKSLGFLDIDVARNAYGRQLDSHDVVVQLKLSQEVQAVVLPFIRAPKITRVDAAVQVLGWVGAEPVLVEQGHVLGATCHPEAATTLVHQYFLEKCY